MIKLLALLKQIPVLFWPLVAVSLVLIIQTARLDGAQKDLAVSRAERQAETATRHEVAASAVADNTLITRGREADKKEISHAADQQAARLPADRRADELATQRLRDKLAALAATCGSAATGDPRAAAPGPAASTAADLLAYVQSRLGEAEGTVADFADASSTAGTACERQYDSLKR
jgi:hypothetical protein